MPIESEILTDLLAQKAAKETAIAEKNTYIETLEEEVSALEAEVVDIDLAIAAVDTALADTAPVVLSVEQSEDGESGSAIITYQLASGTHGVHKVYVGFASGFGAAVTVDDYDASFDLDSSSDSTTLEELEPGDCHFIIAPDDETTLVSDVFGPVEIV